VIEVDVARKRIALSMRKDDPEPRSQGAGAGAARPGGRPGRHGGRLDKPAHAPQGAMAEAFAKLRGQR